MTVLLRAAALASVALVASVAPSAQTTQLRGTVTEDAGPVRLARVTVQEADASGDTLATTFTDAAGLFSVTVAGTSRGEAPVATAYGVGRPFPNPAGGARVTIPFSTPSGLPEPVETETFDLLGRQITTDAPLSSGVYVVRLRFADGSVSEAQRVVVARSGVRIAAEHTAAALTPPTSPDTGAAPTAQAASRTAPVVFVTVERAGFVTETRTVDAAGGADLSVMLTEAPKPTAQIAATGTVQAGTPLTLNGAGSAGADGEALRYSWAFGDGTRGGTGRVAHVYTEAGTYTVTLTVQGAFGATATTTAEVTVTAPPTPAGTATVTLTVRGVSGAAVEGARVTVVGGSTDSGVLTGADGRAVLADVPTGVPVALAVSRDGFATQRVALDLTAGTPSAFREVTLGARQPAQTLRDAEQGGTIGGTEGVRVVLPVEGLIRADGTPATGDVEVRLTPVDVSDAAEIGAFPGAFAGITPDGPAPLILSYGTAEYVFEQSGEELDLAPGKTATIEIPIYIADDGQGNDLAPGDPFPLWSLDETTGEWVLEGEGTVVAAPSSPTGLALRAEVTHFSWWNCDVAPDPFFPTFDFVGPDGTPVGEDTPVTITGSTSAGPANGRSSSGTAGGFGDGSNRLPSPPNIDLFLEAIANNGLDRGTAVVNAEAGSSIIVEIVLRPVGVVGDGSIAADTSLVAGIDPVGDMDTYTFAAEAAEFVRVEVGQASGSTLVGTVTLRDPDGVEVASAPFGSQAGLVTAVAPTAGLYTVEVDGTRNEPGAYTLTLLGRATQQATVGTDATVTVPAGGAVAALVFEGEADQPLDVYLGAEGVRAASVTFVSPTGQPLPRVGNALRQDFGVFTRLPESGTYVALVEAFDGPGTLTLALRPVPTIAIGEAVTGALREGERRSYLFSADGGELVRPGFADPTIEGRSGSVSLVGEGATPSPQIREFSVRELSAGVHRLEVSSSVSFPSFTAAVAPVTVESLSFGSGGRAEVSGEINLPGGLRVYRVDVPVGSGFFANLTAPVGSAAGENGALDVSASIDVAPLLVGQAFPASSSAVQGFETTARFDPEFDAQPGQAPADLLEAFGTRLTVRRGGDQAEAFFVAVSAGRLSGVTSNEPGGAATGSFTLRADVARPAATIQVDDDLAQCPTAATRSLRAALFAADAETVTACAGRYAEATPAVIPSALTLAGANRDNVTVALSTLRQTTVLESRGRDDAPTIRDLTVEANSNALLLRGEDAVVERVAVRLGTAPRAGGIVGVQINGDGAQLNELDMESANVIANVNEAPSVTDSRFAGASGDGMIRGAGAGWTVTGNTFALTGGVAIQIGTQSVGGHTVTGNAITMDGTTNVGSGNALVSVTAGGASAAETVVSGNRIETAEDNSSTTALRLYVNGARIIAERNVVIGTALGGTQGFNAGTANDGEIVVRNSTFSGLGGGSRPVSLFADGPIAFVNNSVAMAPGTDTRRSGVIVQVGFSGSFSDAPVVLVNNVIAGPRGTGIEGSPNVTLVADHNLFFDVDTAYGTNASGGPGDVVGQDPQFLGPLLDVAAESPAVDAGASSAQFTAVPATDIDGTDRPQGAAVDIGAHEQ